MFLEERRTIGAEIESTPYTKETLAATDYNFKAYNISYDPDIASRARKIARGDLDKEPSIMGKRAFNCSFSVDIEYQGAVNVAPAYFKLLQACAMKQTSFAAAGISLVPDADYTNVPITIEIVEKGEGATPIQVVVPGHGCMGNVKLVLDAVGDAIRMDFEFKGVLGTIEDRPFASILTPTGFDSEQPDSVLGATISAYGEVQTIDKTTIDLGNTVEVFTDPSKAEGLIGAHVVSRNSTIELDPDLDLIANQADYGRWTGGTTGAFLMEVGDNIVLSAPAVQYIKAYAPGTREGHTVNNKSMELKRGPLGNDSFEILQGAKA